jgi:pimeloyl-ACP methyl ester carboxylesterase
MPLPPLILIHGYPFDHTMWKSVIIALGNKTKVIAPDLPGFGDNPVENAEPSLDLMADDIAELFELHRITHAVVAGMSMGGYVALAFAERHKERLAGLGLISTQSIADTPETQQARRAMIEKVRREGVTPAIEALLPKLFGAAEQNNSELKRFPTQGAQNAGVEGICWALEAMARRPDRTDILRKLEIPAVVIHGAKDKIVPAERAKRMAQLIPDSKYIEFSGGHASPLEAPKAVADALLDLLQRSANYQPPAPRKHLYDEPGIIIAPNERGL